MPRMTPCWGAAATGWRAERVSVWKMLVLLALLGFPAALISTGPVAWQGHLGGFAVGWAIGSFLHPRRLIRHPFM